MRRALPVSLLFFVVAALWAGLQAVPIVGIVLLFMIAPMWSIAFLNAGFAGVAAEAIAGRVSRFWLVLPVAWFGGYLAFALNDYRSLEHLRADIAATNASVHVPFDARREALVIKGNEGQTDLVDNYDIPVAYSENPNFEGFSHLSFRMIDQDACSAIRADGGTQRAGINVFGFHDQTGNSIGSSVFEKRFCNLQQPEDPSLPVVLVETKESKIQVGSLPVTLTTTTVATPDGKSYTLRGGVAAPLPWLPMPVVGCWQWEKSNCVAMFWRKSFVPLVSKPFRYGPDPTVANALGLRPVSPQDRRAVDAGAVMQMVEAKREMIVAQELAVLDAVIGDVATKAGSLPFRSLAGQDELLLPRLPAMVTAVERGIDRDQGRSNAQQVFNLIKGLPQDAVAPYRPRLDALRFKDGWFRYEDKDQG